MPLSCFSPASPVKPLTPALKSRSKVFLQFNFMKLCDIKGLLYLSKTAIQLLLALEAGKSFDGNFGVSEVGSISFLSDRMRVVDLLKAKLISSQMVLCHDGKLPNYSQSPSENQKHVDTQTSHLKLRYFIASQTGLGCKEPLKII